VKPTFLAASLLTAFAFLPAAHAQDEPQDLSNPDSAFVDTTPKKAWQAEITETERGHLIGNPDADAQLIEFISYTCPHCADFAKRAGPTMDLALIAPGRMGIEVRPVIRNWLDLTVSLLVQCGDTAGFKDRHRLFLYSQDDWLQRAANSPRSQQEAWSRATAEARLSAARALDLDDTLANQGMALPVINACLADDQAAKKLIADAAANKMQFEYAGTPSFALDGELVEGVYSWEALSPVLEARFAPGTGVGGG
jgi:protein-disulfide isomerase